MAENENRSVVERLDDIEKKVTWNTNPPTISEQIGEDFGEYLKSSTLFYYEPDERKFVGWKKRKIISLAIYFFFEIVILALSVFFWLDGIADGAIWGFLASLILLIVLVLALVMTIRSKPIMKAQSPLNFQNHYFYLAEELRLVKEEEKTGLAVWIAKILSYASAILFIVSLIVGIMDIHGDTWLVLLFAMGMTGGMMLAILVSSLPFRSYHYPSHYIFEKEDSRVIRYHHQWRKEKK